MKKKCSSKRPQCSRKVAHFCPKCLSYSYSNGRCSKCGYKKTYVSVLKDLSQTIEDIPKEDWVRIIQDRKQNGYYVGNLEKYLKIAKSANRPIPREQHQPLYGLSKPKAQRRSSTGIANHYAPSQFIHTVHGGGCSAK